ncbi:MFS transporter [Candidatus Bipolaricaulota bacterium]|nr:MFS transporter [Candidatus Bipolaricaulota bacterium]
MVRAFRSWWNEAERWYIAVGLANLVLGTSSILIPLSVAKIFDRSVGSVGVLASLVSLVGVLGSLIWGRLSDATHRRKPFIVLGYAAAGLSFLGISLARSFTQLAILNMLLNFFWVANASVAVLLVIENRPEGTWERKIGHLNQIGALGWVLGLAIGGIWMQWMPAVMGELTAIRILFSLMGLVGLTASMQAIRTVPCVEPQFTERSFRGVLLAMGNFISERGRFAPLHLYHRLHPKRVFALLTRSDGFRPGVKRFFLSTLISFIGLGFFGIPLPMLLSQQFGLPTSTVFVFFLLQHVGIVLAYPLASRRIRRLGNRYVQMGALWARVLLFGGFAAYLAFFGDSPPRVALIAAFVVYGISWSYFQLSGTALTSRLASEQNRGLALGLYNAIAGTGWIIAGAGSGLVASYVGYPLTFAIASGLLVLSLLVLLFVPDPTADSETDQAERASSVSGTDSPSIECLIRTSDLDAAEASSSCTID